MAINGKLFFFFKVFVQRNEYSVTLCYARNEVVIQCPKGQSL